MHVAALWRYPVKSMGGEPLAGADVGVRGITGDRRFAVVDCADGRVASAKYPRKWGALLDCVATTDGDGVMITLPDGSSVHADDPSVHGRLSAYLGREVTLTDVAPDGATYEADWPPGTMPDSLLQHVAIGEGDEGTLTALPMEPGVFVDVAPMHVVSQVSVDEIGDVRRFRPNVVVTGGDQVFEENAWVGRAFTVGSVGLAVTMSTMRCVMTTLPQRDLQRDRGVLRALTDRNRVDIPGFGTWSCLGVYATVATPGTIRVGDAVTG